MADTSTRQEKRTPVTLKIKFKSATLDQFIERYSVDVSHGGIFIRTKDPLPVGTSLRFEFQLRDASPLITGEGTVVWTRDNDPTRSGVAPGMGVRFDRLSPESQEVLERILTQKAAQGPKGGEVSPSFLDAPTKVGPASLVAELAKQQKVEPTQATPFRKTILGMAMPPRSGFTDERTDATPLPKPMPFHTDAEEFSEEAFEQQTRVASLDALVAQSAEMGADGDEMGRPTVQQPRPELAVVDDDGDKPTEITERPDLAAFGVGLGQHDHGHHDHGQHDHGHHDGHDQLEGHGRHEGHAHYSLDRHHVGVAHHDAPSGEPRDTEIMAAAPADMAHEAPSSMPRPAPTLLGVMPPSLVREPAAPPGSLPLTEEPEFLRTARATPSTPSSAVHPDSLESTLKIRRERAPTPAGMRTEIVTPPGKRSSGAVIALLGAVVVLGLVGAYVLMGRGDEGKRIARGPAAGPAGKPAAAAAKPAQPAPSKPEATPAGPGATPVAAPVAAPTAAIEKPGEPAEKPAAAGAPAGGEAAVPTEAPVAPPQPAGVVAVVESEPIGADATLVDGNQTGPTPMKFTGLEAKKAYKVRVSMAGYQEQVVTIKGGQTAAAMARLKPLPRVLKISSRPSGAEVWVNGKRKGVTPLELTLDGALAGQTKVGLVLKKGGFETTSADVDRDSEFALESKRMVRAVDVILAARAAAPTRVRRGGVRPAGGEPPVAGSAQPTEPVEKPAEPVEKPAEPVEKPAEPTEKPAEPPPAEKPVEKPAEPPPAEKPPEKPEEGPVPDWAKQPSAPG